MEKIITFGQQQDVDKNLGTNLYRTSVVCESTRNWMLGVVIVCPNSRSENDLKSHGNDEELHERRDTLMISRISLISVKKIFRKAKLHGFLNIGGETGCLWWTTLFSSKFFLNYCAVKQLINVIAIFPCNAPLFGIHA